MSHVHEDGERRKIRDLFGSCIPIEGVPIACGSAVSFIHDERTISVMSDYKLPILARLLVYSWIGGIVCAYDEERRVLSLH